MYDITLWCIEKQKLSKYGLISIAYHKEQIKLTRKSSVDPEANCMFEIQYKYMMGITIVSRLKTSPPEVNFLSACFLKTAV